jgi:hypothetical protein
VARRQAEPLSQEEMDAQLLGLLGIARQARF